MDIKRQNQNDEIKNDISRIGTGTNGRMKSEAGKDNSAFRISGRKTATALRAGMSGTMPAFLIAAVTALLLIARSCVYGFRYFPQLDDYIQYWYYQKYSSFAELQQDSGILGSRPLAGLADYFVWSRLPMIASVIILSVIFAVSAVLIRNALKRYFDLSALFPVLMTLLPLGIEASYWLSASTRIIMGLFAAALSEILFVRWLDARGLRGVLCLVFSALLMTASYEFYEQTGLLAAALVFVTACLEGRRNGARPLGFLMCVPASLAAFAIQALFSVKGSVYSSRVKDSLESSSSFGERLERLADQLYSVFIEGGGKLVTKGFSRSASFIESENLAGWLILVILLCCLMFLVAFAEKPEKPWRPGRSAKKRDLQKSGVQSSNVKNGSHVIETKRENARTARGPAAAVLSALFLSAAPVAVFMLQDKPWFSFRNAAASFAGFALLADYLVCLILSAGGEKQRRIVSAALAAAAAFFFMFCSVSEMSDYRDVYNYDTEVAKAVAPVIEADTADGYDKYDKFAVIGVTDEDKDDQNYFWHDHILSCTSSSWAFGGLLRYTAEDYELPNVVPLGTLEIYDKSNKAANDPRQFQHLYYYDSEKKTACRVKLEMGEGVDISDSLQYWNMIDSEGNRVGTLVISENSAKLLK